MRSPCNCHCCCRDDDRISLVLVAPSRLTLPSRKYPSGCVADVAATATIHRHRLRTRSPNLCHTNPSALGMLTRVDWRKLCSSRSPGGHSTRFCLDIDLCLSSSFSSSLWLAAIKACATARDVELGTVLQEAWRWPGDAVLAGNALVSMYAKCGRMENARGVFDRMQQRDVVSWTALILGYVESRQEEVALALFLRCRGRENDRPCVPDARLFVAALKACSSLMEDCCDRSGILDTGIAIHEDAIGSGHASNLFVQNSLVDMYAKGGNLASSRRVFEEMADRDVVSFNSIMLGYVDNDEPRLALDLFSRMKRTMILPDARSFLLAIKACTCLAAAEEETPLVGGKSTKVKALETSMKIHSQAESFASSDIFVANSLVTTYAKCGALVDARAAFDKVICHDVVSWNALILGYAENDEPDMALDLQSHMSDTKSCLPNSQTFVAALKACTVLASREDCRNIGKKQGSRLSSLSRGGRLHAQIVSRCCEMDVYVASALVDMYAKCGNMTSARRVFDGIDRSTTNVVTWNAIILGYVDVGDPASALELLACMRLEQDCRPNSVTLVAALKASGESVAALESVKAIHALVNRTGMEEELVLTALVDSYGKCGSLGDCEQVFVSVLSRNSVTWNALLAGYSRVGDVRRSIHLFDRMLEEKVSPSSATFVCLLTACSHAGLVDTGCRFFGLMQSNFHEVPNIDHYHCLIDMLGRANRIKEAVAVATAMPFKGTSITWTIVLSSCWKWRDVEMGSLAFGNLVKLDGKVDAACLLMAKLYRSRGMSEEEVDCTRV